MHTLVFAVAHEEPVAGDICEGLRASPLGVLKGPQTAYEDRRRQKTRPAMTLISEFPPTRLDYLPGGPKRNPMYREASGGAGGE
jgi:hypothetical protein